MDCPLELLILNIIRLGSKLDKSQEKIHTKMVPYNYDNDPLFQSVC